MKTRNTVQRQIVLEAVRRLHDHPTADDVYAEISQTHPSISKATVYRNLYQLAEQELILRVPMAHGADRFDFNVKPHYHMRCADCGELFDVNVPYLHDLMEKAVPEENVELTGFEITFAGICESCLQQKKAQ